MGYHLWCRMVSEISKINRGKDFHGLSEKSAIFEKSIGVPYEILEKVFRKYDYDFKKERIFLVCWKYSNFFH